MDTVITITVTVPAARDNTGDVVSTGAPITIENVWVGWEQSHEDTDFRDSAVTSTTLWVPSDAPDIPHTATITAPGVKWRVSGEQGSSVHPMTGFDFGRRPVPVTEVK